MAPLSILGAATCWIIHSFLPSDMTTCPLAKCFWSREAVINASRVERRLLSVSGHWRFCRGGQCEMGRRIMSVARSRPVWGAALLLNHSRHREAWKGRFLPTSCRMIGEKDTYPRLKTKGKKVKGEPHVAEYRSQKINRNQTVALRPLWCSSLPASHRPDRPGHHREQHLLII